MLMVKTKARQQKQSLNGSTMLGVSPVKKKEKFKAGNTTKQQNTGFRGCACHQWDRSLKRASIHIFDF